MLGQKSFIGNERPGFYLDKYVTYVHMYKYMYMPIHTYTLVEGLRLSVVM